MIYSLIKIKIMIDNDNNNSVLFVINNIKFNYISNFGE